MMSRKVRKMLDRIDAVLAQPDDATDEQRKDSRDLWAVLSALRGPDTDRDYRDLLLKSRVTILIRRAAFPLTASTGNGTPQAVFESAAANAVHLDTRIMAAELNSNERADLVHFVDHARLAGRALGLLALDPEAAYTGKVMGIPQKVVSGADQS